jgi:hypothetical protein
MDDDLLWWMCMGLGSAPAWGTLLWTIWEHQIRPLLIPFERIEAEAAQLIACYGQKASEIAEIQQDRAYRYANPFEQARWQRVRRAIKIHSRAKTRV